MIFKPAAAGVVSVLMFAVSRVALAQNGTMMNGGGWMSGYGGILMPILVVIVVAGVVLWLVEQKGKRNRWCRLLTPADWRVRPSACSIGLE